ncbi:LuxR C-terminal-related transcriptional regulator [Novosphingobium sp. MMS21-SN21R]|uniref:LuxR C-terminal-related transcriptional regulator n=1 Tax=Novosphingobium sp. MMS21-SN21R TaxID=2969298 RepID=UPI00288800D1|nr:LuxR C-terminal-related transcriptional regulator [Novosphingobium sp. MMS21-SN21R]MDT0509608.1 LuxR C-terminal-related transcriptional regulator [Novosphingobium sp. MMS21-SN21R]
MGLVPTTIIPPRTTSIIVPRKGFLNLVDAICRARLVTFCAPAGSGKTTAALYCLNQMKAQGRPALWLSVRAGIRDFPSFFAALGAAGIAAGLDWGHLEREGTEDLWLAALAQVHEQPPVLVIDDAQLLPVAVLNFVSQAIASARDAMTVILVSRGALPIPVARARSLGFLVEVGAPELAFDDDEASELITRVAGVPVDAEIMQQIIRDAHGWASGLVIGGELYRRELARGKAWQPLSDNLRREFTGYFSEEVLELQTPEMRDFLINTCILDELTGPACAAVTGDDNARATLDDAFRAGLFIDAIDEERSVYAYHPLFRALALGRLHERAFARAAELHRRASRFYAGQGELLKALEHASASGDQEFLADQLDLMANDLTTAGHLNRLDQIASDLPWSVSSTRPMLVLAMAWRRIRRLSFSAASRLIDTAVALRDNLAAEGKLDTYTATSLDHHIRHRTIMLAAAQDDLSRVERDAEALISEIGDDEAYLSCTLLAQVIAARREFYHFQDTLKLEAEVRRALDRPGAEFSSIALKCSIVPTLLVQGKSAIARRFSEEALASAGVRDAEIPGLAALPALPYAELLYEIGELDLAGQLVERYLPGIRQWGMVDQLASGYLVRARLAFARGDSVSALAGLEEAHLVAIECGLDRLRAHVVAEQVRILVKSGHIDEAEAAMRAIGQKLDDEPVPTLNPSRRRESLAIAWIRIEMQRHRLVRASKVATRWLEFVRRSGAVRSAVEFELLLAEIFVLQGNRSKARRAVRSAVELAEPAGWIRVFLDEGEVISALLSEAYANGPALDTRADKFAAMLVARVDNGPAMDVEEGEGAFGLTGRLASREVDILIMVGGGLRNREIGERLGLTEGTVKWYMQQIYDKLGVRRRPQAVLRARQFGILT